MPHSVPLDVPSRDFEPTAHPPGLLDPVHSEPRRQAVGIAVVTERVVNAGEIELDSHAVAVVGHPAGLAQLRLSEGQPVERELVQVGVVGYPPAVGGAAPRVALPGPTRTRCSRPFRCR